jgi:hypothetical protein
MSVATATEGSTFRGNLKRLYGGLGAAGGVKMKTRTRALEWRIAACGALALPAIAQPVFALQQENGLAARAAFLGAFFVVLLILGIACYVYLALCLQTIAKKTHTPNGWLAWIPIGNFVLMINIARKPMWWMAPFLVPFAAPVAAPLVGKVWWVVLGALSILDLVLSVMLWMAIAKARNKPGWWGILILVPLVGLVVPGYLAFSGDVARTSPPTPQGALESSLYCVSGEFAHDTVEIPGIGLYIGRDPSKANLVLGSHEISTVHARVWPEPGGSQVWVEDWNSLNGTYYRPDGQASPSEWVQLKGKVLLSRGARFRLGDNIAEFEIKAAANVPITL